MKDTSRDLMLAEYDRLITLEKYRLENYGQALQFYLTVITAAIGALLFLSANSSTVSQSRLLIILLLAAILLLGEVTQLRLVGEDMELLEISKRYQLIRDAFVKQEEDLATSFPKILVLSDERFRSWSSIRGILRRALTISGAKTTVVLLNCVFATSTARHESFGSYAFKNFLVLPCDLPILTTDGFSP